MSLNNCELGRLLSSKIFYNLPIANSTVFRVFEGGGMVRGWGVNIFNLLAYYVKFLNVGGSMV